jgi:hypothetical protein
MEQNVPNWNTVKVDNSGLELRAIKFPNNFYPFQQQLDLKTTKIACPLQVISWVIVADQMTL